MIPRLFLPLKEDAGTVHITGDKARYLITVLRCKMGDALSLFDGKGTSYRARIKEITRRDVVAEILHAGRDDAESPLSITLVQGLLRGEKMDLVIQKTTELGVREIIPTITERSQIRETRKIARWKKIAEEAAEQCGRSLIPVIHDVISYADIFSSSACAFCPNRNGGLLFWEEGGAALLEKGYRGQISQPLMIVIGPEGGFTREEVALAETEGFSITSLGKRILRAETAAIAATTLVQFLFGDLGDGYRPGIPNETGIDSL